MVVRAAFQFERYEELVYRKKCVTKRGQRSIVYLYSCLHITQKPKLLRLHWLSKL